jgi:aspartyl protease family protein
MAGKRARKAVPHFMLLAGCCLSAVTAMAVDVGLAGVIATKAMVTINGGSPQTLAIGQAVDGVRLVSIQGDQAVFEVDGKKRPLRVGQHAVGTPGGDGGGKVILTADNQGHFVTTGTINGVSVKFLVDTGATMISLGASDARRIGLDGNQGERGITQTANGQAIVSRVKLDTVRLGDITLHNVDALIHQNEMPVALLGMSFLNRMEMQRDGSSMTLKKRF